jgi:anti-sigma B factor antagonist
MGLEVATARRDDLVVVTLSGELDIYTVPGFRREVADIDPSECTVVVEMSEVTLIDSSGLGALVGLRNRADHAGRRVGIAGPSPRVMRVLEVTGLREAFVVGAAVESVAAAAMVTDSPSQEA